jgi:UDP-N-acetylmuramoyl-L-alanyl-D-glutamate--2,6-diaminopimelate ligase
MPADDSPPAHASRSNAGRSGSPRLRGAALRRRLDDAGLLDAVLRGDGAPALDALTVPHVADDSRKVQPGGLFVAVPGRTTDGHAFIDKAIQNGASAVVCERVPVRFRTRHPRTAFVRVTDARAALAEIAAAHYGDPARTLEVTGVTGTNGKTTVAYLVHHMLEALGETTGLISTVEVRTGAVATNAALTTPGALELQRTLRRMVGDGCGSCAMEVSSHALDQSRVRAVDYDVALFTNLTTDHLDYHGTKAHYRAAKKRLFDGLGPDAKADVNADDEAADALVADTDARVVTVGLEDATDGGSPDGGDRDVSVRVLESTIEGLRLSIGGRERTFRLAGRFNAYNLALAYAAGRASGHAPDALLDALADAPPVPGRFERLSFDDGRTVIVDYAHTPDALENVLQTVGATMPAEGALWCVFGCGGDRDRSKRRTMGSVAEHCADRVIVTSDNPRSEEPEAIMNDIRRGMSRPGDAAWIVDRDAAIRAAAEQARAPDVVVVAGKGHETVQVVGDEKRPFDDREVAKRHFESCPQ